MKTRPTLIGLLFAAALAAAAQDAPRAIQVAEPPAQPEAPNADTVVSRSNQFRISGGDSLTRATAALLAEETKDELLQLTAEKDQWKVPVAIALHGKPGDPLPARTLSTRLLVVEGVRQLQLDKHLSPGLEQERFKRAVTAMLLYERNLNANPAGAPDADLIVPPWLADGLREATAWRLNQSDRRLYASLFKQGGLFKLDELFAVSEKAFENLDGATRAAFRVSSGALVMALLEQPQGKDGFRGFLTEIAAYQGELPVLLRKHFPELNLSETSLSKWWALQLANMGGLNLATDIFTIAQTEAALADALKLNFRTPEGIIQQKEITAWPEVAALKEAQRVAAVRMAEDALVRLSYRCFPSYRPLLANYQSILGDIAANRNADLAEALAKLDETRATMVSRANRARDYLDWFEITRARQTSGEFDDYLRLKEELKSNPHRRKDELSLYLDRMDMLFHRDGDTAPTASPADMPPLPAP
jgi:hypothetical protein